MQVMLSNFNVLFKLVNRLTGKGTPIAEPVPATDDSITVLYLSDSTLSPFYQNKPLTGWRNWTTIRNAIYAQHPTEEWYVKVDIRSVFLATVAKNQTQEELSLGIHVSSALTVQLVPCSPEQTTLALSEKLKYARLTAKQKNEPRFVVRFILNVNEADQILTVMEVDEHSYLVFDIDWMALLAKYNLTLTDNCTVFDEIAQARHPNVTQIPFVVGGLVYNTQNPAQPVKFGRHLSERDSQFLVNPTIEALQGLQQIGVNTTVPGPNFTTNGWDDIEVNVTIQQFFQLCDLGWFFAQWLTPRPHVYELRPFHVAHRKVNFAHRQKASPEIINFQYFVKQELHCVEIFNNSSNNSEARFTAPTFPELAQRIRAWMLHNLETISLQLCATAWMTEDLQVVDTHISL